ncbi:hypothetical protein FE772_13340 [Lysobacter enzymogenes]|nr:hypothetical protein [Lysobacter enzymogenes]QCW26502.1 hypothetical protein FE772_13340 [Lysobacter enzymogenes]
MRAQARRQRAGDAQQHAQAVAQRARQRAALGRRERVPGALVEDQRIEAGQGRRIDAQRRVAELQAGADRELGMQLDAGVAGPAPQVLEFRPGRAGQQQHARRRLGLDRQRQRHALDRALPRIERAQDESGAAGDARHRIHGETAVGIGYDAVDALAGRIEQFHRAAVQALRATVHGEGFASPIRAGVHTRRCRAATAARRSPARARAPRRGRATSPAPTTRTRRLCG